MVTVFFANTKLGSLYITISNRSCVNLVKIFSSRKGLLSPIALINFKTDSEPILDFKAFDTRCLHFFEYQTGMMAGTRFEAIT